MLLKLVKIAKKLISTIKMLWTRSKNELIVTYITLSSVVGRDIERMLGTLYGGYREAIYRKGGCYVREVIGGCWAD